MENVDFKNVRGLLRKLHGVAQKMPPIPVNGEGTDGNGNAFRYKRDEDILKALRPILAENGVLYVPTVTDQRVEAIRQQLSSGEILVHEATVTLRLTFIDIETGEAISVSFPGTAADRSSAPTSWATTVAEKCGLSRMFMLVSENQEQPSAEEPAAEGAQSAAPQNGSPAKPAEKPPEKPKRKENGAKAQETRIAADLARQQAEAGTGEQRGEPAPSGEHAEQGPAEGLPKEEEPARSEEAPAAAADRGHSDAPRASGDAPAAAQAGTAAPHQGEPEPAGEPPAAVRQAAAAAGGPPEPAAAPSAGETVVELSGEVLEAMQGVIAALKEQGIEEVPEAEVKAGKTKNVFSVAGNRIWVRAVRPAGFFKEMKFDIHEDHASWIRCFEG